MTQQFEKIGVDEVYAKAESLHSQGYRMVQICGITGQGHTEILYSFDKDHELRNYNVIVPFGTSVKSITPVYWAAFVYENEVHDLFGVEFTESKLDYKGNFFRMSAVTPWKGQEADKGVQ